MQTEGPILSNFLGQTEAFLQGVCCILQCAHAVHASWTHVLCCFISFCMCVFVHLCICTIYNVVMLPRINQFMCNVSDVCVLCVMCSLAWWCAHRVQSWRGADCCSLLTRETFFKGSWLYKSSLSLQIDTWLPSITKIKRIMTPLHHHRMQRAPHEHFLHRH